MSSCDENISLNKTCNKEIFWLDDFSQLYINNNFLNFFPKYDMTRIEQLNALTRFFLYYFIIILIFGKEKSWLLLPITGFVVIIIIYYIYINDNMSKQKEFDRIINMREKKRMEDSNYLNKELEYDGKPDITIEDLDESIPDDFDNTYSLESGYYDSDNRLRIGNKVNVPKYNKSNNNSLYTVDEIVKYQENTCKKPTRNNPFMNSNITNYNNDFQPTACNAENDEIKDDMYVNFNHGLFRDVDELWERANSQRQFYTMPNTSVPNNQVEFAKWLYLVPETCKEDQVKCLRYTDLRYER